MTLILFIILSILLTKLPFVGKYFAVVNTLVHEAGHAIMALITGGKVEKIQLFANTEGVAWTSNRFWIGRVLTSAAGYVFSSATACLFLYLISMERYDYVLYFLITLLVVSLICWIRNFYGFFWMITFCSGFGYLLWNGTTTLTEYVLLFITSIILVQSVISAFEIMYLSFKDSRNAGDATSLARSIIIIPAQIWGIAFFLQSLYFAWYGLKIFFEI